MSLGQGDTGHEEGRPFDVHHAATTCFENPPGAKPVAPSWHPEAVEGLRIPAPKGSVLLPQLTLPNEPANKDVSSTTTSSGPLWDFNAETIKLQRPSIKVRIITWNQGNSVPKGDLGVLLGRVGEYIAPPEGWDASSQEEDSDDEGTSTQKRKYRGLGIRGQENIPRKDRIPPLPHDDAHPYHVVVVAGQECPWGDGKRIARGVGLAGELGDLSRSKSRAPQNTRDKLAKGTLAEKGKAKDDGDMDEKSPVKVDRGKLFRDGETLSPDVNPAISSHSQGGAPGWGISGKGWSDMCEDWLCRGPLAQATATKHMALATKGGHIASGATTPTTDNGASPLPSRPSSPPLHLESDSANHILQDTDPAKRVSWAAPRRMIRSMSRQKVDTIATVAHDRVNRKMNEESDLSTSSSPPTRPDSPLKQVIDSHMRDAESAPANSPTKKAQRLALRIPGLSGSHHVTVQSDGTPLSLGAYELVTKERCYMMYTAIYVWRGCLDRVRGSSVGNVKSGLLAGRVGNKGAVGISLKLGTTRLLFVNAHLAAHEGKVAERIANVEKIKKELKVNTFLPEGDPRNKEDDLTACFDHAFWFGDLNFRVNISRRHADWLMLNKQYEHALAFDQLRQVMKEQPQLFFNFHEAPIKFPPTFKYDVLKTIKVKKQDEKGQRIGKLKDQPAMMVPDKDTSIAQDNGIHQTEVPINDHLSRDDDTSTISSVVHSSYAGSAGNTSDTEETSPISAIQSSFSARSDPSDALVANNTAAAEGLGVHGKAIKVRKRILSIASSAVGAVINSPNKDAGSKRDFKSSASSTTLPQADRYAILPKNRPSIQPPSIQVDEEAKSIESAARNDIESDYRRDKQNKSFVIGHELSDGNASEDELNHTVEIQPYDTSAKQRVPSWCDRVLWRSNASHEGQKDEKASNIPLRSKLSTTVNTALTRLHAKAEPAPSKVRSTEATDTISPMDPQPLSSRAFTTTSGTEPPRRKRFSTRYLSQNLPTSRPVSKHPARRSESIHLNSEKRTMSALDLSIHAKTPTARPRGLSHFSHNSHDGKLVSATATHSHPGSPMSSTTRNRQSVDLCKSKKTNLSPFSIDSKNSFDGSATYFSSSRKFPGTSPPSSPPANQPRRVSWWSERMHNLTPFVPAAFTNAFRQMSTNSPHFTDHRLEERMSDHLVGPRHGEVECLLYKSLDDKEMRLLEGRSDHRPVIFVGSIGVGQ